jgi:hypothetical protein
MTRCPQNSGGRRLSVNPASAVRGPKQVARRGKTLLLSAQEARQLLDSIGTGSLASISDRDRLADQCSLAGIEPLRHQLVAPNEKQEASSSPKPK